MSIRTIEDLIGTSLFISIISSFFSYVHPQKLDVFSIVVLSIFWFFSFFLIYIAYQDRKKLKIKKLEKKKKDFILDDTDYLKLNKIFKKDDSL